MDLKISNGLLLLPNGSIGHGNVYIQQGSVAKITEADLPADNIIDAAGCYVSPGFIDIHVHGGGGYEFFDFTPEAILGAANLHARHGTTTIFPTLSAFDPETTTQALDGIQSCLNHPDLLPNIGGVHLEGPYFSVKQCGAQDPHYIRDPDPKEYASLISHYADLIHRWSYAPERDGAAEFQRYLQEHGIIGAAGHTDAQYCHMKAAFDLGCKLITHLYSCTSTITREGGFRRLGVIETAYLLDEMDVEAIADGCHLPPELLQLIYKLKGPEHMCLVTDAIRYGGMTNCESAVGGSGHVAYVIEDGVAKLADRSAFAGSIATADVLIRTCVKKTGISLPDAVAMMTRVPARIMQLPKKGLLQEGYDADLVIFDQDIRVQTVLVNGNQI